MKNVFNLIALLGIVFLAAACDNEMPVVEVDESIVWQTEYARESLGTSSMEPVIYNDYVVFSQYNGASNPELPFKLTAYNKTTGTEAWTWNQPADINLNGLYTERVVHENQLYLVVTSKDNPTISRLMSINLDDGTLIWLSDIELNVDSKIYLHNEQLYLHNVDQSQDSRMYVGDLSGNNFELLTFPNGEFFYNVIGLISDTDETTGHDILYFVANSESFGNLNLVVRWDRNDDTFIVSENEIGSINLLGEIVTTGNQLFITHGGSNGEVAIFNKTTLEYLASKSILPINANSCKMKVFDDNIYFYGSSGGNVIQGNVLDGFVGTEITYSSVLARDVLSFEGKDYILDEADRKPLRVFNTSDGQLIKTLESPYFKENEPFDGTNVSKGMAFDESTKRLYFSDGFDIICYQLD